MTIRFNPRWLLVPVLFLSLQFCRAQIDVPGTLTYDLGSSNAPASQLWDVSGFYHLDLSVLQRNGVAVPVGISFNLVQNSKGSLSSPSNDIEDMEISDNSVFATSTRVSGKVTGSAGTARVHFTLKVNGSGNLGGQDIESFKATLTVDAETDPSTGQLVGRLGKLSKFSGSFQGAPSLKGSADLATPLPAGANGSWNLTLHMAAFSKITGTGIITTTTRPMGFDLSGSIKKGVFNVKAKGALDVPDTVGGVGSSATIQFAPPFDTFIFKGKVLGQKMLFGFPPSS